MGGPKALWTAGSSAAVKVESWVGTRAAKTAAKTAAGSVEQ